MLDIIPYHWCNFLKVDFVTSSFDILNFIQESLNVFLLEVADKFTKEHSQFLKLYLFFAFVE